MLGICSNFMYHIMYLVFPICAVDSSGLNLPYHLAKPDPCFYSLFDKSTFWTLGLSSLEELKKKKKVKKKRNLLLLCIVKCFSQKSNSQSTLHESSHCTSHLFLHAFCNKRVKSADILKYYLHEVRLLQWMGLFTPQTMVSF